VNNEIYQYLQSIQASLAAPITAVFLIGILWKGATARAALTTLVFGGIMGGGRFLLDVLHNGLGWDLGRLNAFVEFSFLNFSVILFFVSVGIMFWLSRPSERRSVENLADVTLDWQNGAAEIAGRTNEKIMTVIISVVIVGLWSYFG
jgi:SSS family solute:Na+ symporter